MQLGAAIVKRTSLLIAGGLFMISTGGCALPDYFHPGGYSSTARQRLHESHVNWPEPQTPVVSTTRQPLSVPAPIPSLSELRDETFDGAAQIFGN